MLDFVENTAFCFVDVVQKFKSKCMMLLALKKMSTSFDSFVE